MHGSRLIKRPHYSQFADIVSLDCGPQSLQEPLKRRLPTTFLLPLLSRSCAAQSVPRNAQLGAAVPAAAVEAGKATRDQARAARARTKPAAFGALTDAIRKDLASRWPARYCHVDDHAFVLNTVPSSEDRQKKLIRMTIESAERFAILTTYNINPTQDHEPGCLSGTTFAMLESLARKQHDKDFTFVLLYNDNKLQTMSGVAPITAAITGTTVPARMSLKSRSNTPGKITWPAVVEAYNRQQNDAQLRLGKVKCGIYFVAAEPKGIAGSHHNKFCVNDHGVAATLGASIANKTKDGWMDGGCITVSAPLATSQRDYFLDELMGGHPVRCARLRMDDETPAMHPVGNPALIRARVGGAIRSPLDLEGAGNEAAMARFGAALGGAGVPLEGERRKVLWIQNPSDGYRNTYSMGGSIKGKPIGRALATVFRSAVAGETLDIASTRVGTEAFSLVAEALSKGCNVNLLVNRRARQGAEELARGLYANSANLPPGRLTIRHYAPNEQLVRQQNLNTRQEQVLHAKNYVLTRHDGTCVVMTGSYNLDGQSHYRSNENLMVFEAPDTKFRRVLFDDLHEASDSEVSHYPGPRTELPLSLGCLTSLQPRIDTRRT